MSDRASVQAAAVEAAFGNLHVAINIAGIGLLGSPIMDVTLGEWDWAMGVNVHGVILGIQTFLPLIQKHGEGRHILGTASIGGLQVNPGWHITPYSMRKNAVVALSEGLLNKSQGSSIGVSGFARLRYAPTLPILACAGPSPWTAPMSGRNSPS